MKKIKISQSLIKDWDSHSLEELCGYEFESKHITDKWDRTWQDSPTKALGRYFEYILTGAMPTGYKETPQPVYMKSGLNKKEKNPDYELTVNDMMGEYRLAHKNADRIIELMLLSGIKIESAQVYREKGVLTGNIDVEADFNGKKINIDVKYSGLLFDKWNKFGWMWMPEQMDYHGLQAKQYTLLNGRPTYFLVVSSTNDKDVKFFLADIDQFYLDQHELRANDLVETLRFVNEIGWENYPTLKKCSACPLKNSCKDKLTTLVPEVIEIIDND